jgi:hypothetical protein
MIDIVLLIVFIIVIFLPFLIIYFNDKGCFGE